MNIEHFYVIRLVFLVYLDIHNIYIWNIIWGIETCELCYKYVIVFSIIEYYLLYLFLY